MRKVISGGVAFQAPGHSKDKCPEGSVWQSRGSWEAGKSWDGRSQRYERTCNPLWGLEEKIDIT